MKWNDDPFIINYYQYLITKDESMSDDDVVVLSLVLHQGIAVFVGKVKDSEEAECWADVELAFDHLFVDMDEGDLG